MKRTIISDILKEQDPKKLEGEKVLIKGWVRAFRSNRFIQINDGSCLSTLQAVIEYEKFDEEILKKITTGSAVSIKGEIVASIGSKQSIEVQTTDIQIIGTANPEDVQKTILQPKKHSLEILRDQAHLRFRTNLFGAVFRIRHSISYAIHKYFNDHGFYYYYDLRLLLIAIWSLVTGGDSISTCVCSDSGSTSPVWNLTSPSLQYN